MMRARSLVAGLMLVCVAVAACCTAHAVEKKLIAVGWDMPNAQALRANYEQMDKLPFRGTSLRFSGRGGKPFLDFAHSREVWKPEDLEQIIEDFAAAQPTRLTCNFLDIKATPGDVDWFDDEGWVIIADHWRSAARVAKLGGQAGLLFDPESYKSAQFGYASQPQMAEHSFEEYRQMARQRGREVMQAACEADPDLTVFALFMLSIFGQQAHQQPAALAGNSYGLYPAFIDGWLDAVPPTATLIDGCENAYRYNSDLEFLAAANRIRNTCQGLVSPENRYKYRAQVQVSFGLYLDAFVNPPDANWYIDPGEQTPLECLERNLTSALNAADEYVWLYGEQASWFAPADPASDRKRWVELLPGVEEMLWSVIDPVAHAARLLAAADPAANLVQNGDFAAQAGTAPPGPQADDWQTEGAPAGWGFWQSKAAASEGSPGWDGKVGHTAPGSATMRDVKSGCLIQSVQVTPGGRYAVSAWVRRQGRGVPGVRVRWHTPEGKWHAEGSDSFLSPAESEGDWRRLVGVVRVPEGAGRLVLLLLMDGQPTRDDIVWWDDVVVFETK